MTTSRGKHYIRIHGSPSDPKLDKITAFEFVKAIHDLYEIIPWVKVADYLRTRTVFAYVDRGLSWYLPKVMSEDSLNIIKDHLQDGLGEDYKVTVHRFDLSK